MLVPDPSVDPDVRRAVADTRALPSFDAAAVATLQFLQSEVPAGAWLITRVAGDDWVVLRASAPGYPVADADVFRWSDSFCSRMVRGEGPRIATRSAEVPAYEEAPIGRVVPIAGYLGIPLTGADGTLLGTLCAIDPEPFDVSVHDAQPLLELQGRLLASLLDLELRAVRAERGPRAVLAPDPRELLEREGRTLRTHASAASVLVLDGVPFGDEHVVVAELQAGESMCRLDVDLCAVVLPEVPLAVAEQRATRLVEALQRRGLTAYVGVAGTTAGHTDLPAAVAVARDDLASAVR